MGNKVLKLAAIAVITPFIGAAYAVGTGFYLGAMLGPASNTAKPQEAKTESGTPPMTTVKPRTNQFGTRLYLGNKFNEYAAIELGGTYYTTINFNNQGVDTCGGTDAKVRTIELLGKGEYETPWAVGVFAKGGLAITYLTTAGGLNSSATDCGKQKREIKYRPALAIGASYDLNQNWVTDITWTRTMVGSIVGNVDFYAIGISYHFANKYCGQFLCDD